MIERISWHGWNNVYRIWNQSVQLLVLADVGPRIISYSFPDGENVLREVASDIGWQGGGEFRLYGGHRLWVSPEVERTYFPDNRPVTVEHHGNRACFTAPVENAKPGTNLQKELELELEETGSCVHLVHRVINHDSHPTELAAWAPTMMKAGGRAILPLPPRIPMDKDHYLPVGPLTLWSFTDLADPRWRFGTEYIQLIQQTHPICRYEEQMTGIFNPAGWGAYFCQGSLFVKRAADYGMESDDWNPGRAGHPNSAQPGYLVRPTLVGCVFDLSISVLKSLSNCRSSTPQPLNQYACRSC